MLDDVLGGVSKLAVWTRVAKAVREQPVSHGPDALTWTIPWPLLIVLILIFLWVAWKLWR